LLIKAQANTSTALISVYVSSWAVNNYKYIYRLDYLCNEACEEQ